MLLAAQFAVGVGRSQCDGIRKKSAGLGAQQQGDVAHVVGKFRVLVGMAQHQVLHGKLYIHHAAGAVLHVKLIALDDVG